MRIERRVKIFLIVIGMFMANSAISQTGLIETTYAATALELNKTSVVLTKGQIAKLKVNNAKGKVGWKTSDERIATVSNTGKVTAKAVGKALITATVDGKKCTCKIEIITAKKMNQKACAAYRKMLEKPTLVWSPGQGNSSRCNTAELQFDCADINGDGIKELILYWMETYHAEGWNRVYTYYDGKVKNLGVYTSVDICSDKGYYIDNYSNLGSGYTVYYGITNDGRQKELAYYAWKICEAAYDVYPDDASGEVVKKFDSTGETITYYYAFRINGKGTSYSSCMNRIKKLEKDAKLYELDMKQNTLKMRKKYIC